MNHQINTVLGNLFVRRHEHFKNIVFSNIMDDSGPVAYVPGASHITRFYTVPELELCVKFKGDFTDPNELVRLENLLWKNEKFHIETLSKNLTDMMLTVEPDFVEPVRLFYRNLFWEYLDDVFVAHFGLIIPPRIDGHYKTYRSSHTSRLEPVYNGDQNE